MGDFALVSSLPLMIDIQPIDHRNNLISRAGSAWAGGNQTDVANSTS